MKTVIKAVLLCLIMSAVSGCAASSPRNNAAVCFPPWDFADPAIMKLNASNWGKVVGIACLCEPKNKACKE
ncbi:MAG: hypothetical protein ACI352_04060 [Elusimicrobiaceae bacterium]